MKSFFCISALYVIASAVPSTQIQRRSGYAVKNANPVSSKWLQIARAPQSHTIGLRIALKQRAFGELEDRLNQVSDPDHLDYGQWLNDEDVRGLVSPHKDTTNSVKAWLDEHNLEPSGYSSAGDWMFVPVTVQQAEQLLDTEYFTYKHVDSGNELVRTAEYSLPVDLHQHIDVVAPTTYFGDVEAMKASVRLSTQDLPQGCNETQPRQGPPPGYHGPYGHSPIKPSNQTTNISSVCDSMGVTNTCLRTLYRTIDYKPQVPQINYVGVTAYLNESANISDFRNFMSQYRREASVDYTYNVSTISDGINFQGVEPQEYYRVRDLEGNLDAQTVGGFVYPTRFELYSTGGNAPFLPAYDTPVNTNEPFLDWLNYVLAQDRSAIPNTISTSYSDDEQSVPIDYATRVCQEFAQLTSKGVTLLFSSGDSGVGDNQTCFTNDENENPAFLPNFPPSCPYVTAVGGTRDFRPEIVGYDTRNGYVSGAGVSNYFSRPSWQDAAFNNYANQIGDLHKGLWNRSGRAYPDIAAQSFRYVIVYAGQNILLDGTSCAAPTVTGILALVNDALIAAGRPTLGFINPWLYKLGHRAFTDVVSGNVWGCDTSGFPAKKGWDLASGWGTPDFIKLKNIALFGPPASAPFWS